MKHPTGYFLSVLAVAVSLLSPLGGSAEFSGFMTAEGSFFTHAPTFPEQRRHSASVALQPEFYHQWDDGTSFTFVPFGRLDSADSQRSHLDIRELNLLWVGDDWEARVGVAKVFWGATEFLHLVDIINQTDIVESIDAEEKLGQPMGHFTLIKDWGVAEVFILPFFRERTFPGVNGRLRSELIVDTDHPRYESDAKEYHTDFAMRFSHTVEDLDFGLYYFTGTSRDPTLLPSLDASGQPVLIPFYELIEQTGVDLQLVAGEWLWKLEALHRKGEGADFSAATGGFEYSFIGIAETSMDLGLIVEYAYDSRGSSSTSPFQNDIILGLRLAVNDLSDSTLLAGWFQDLQSPAKIFQIEAGRRFGEQVKASLEARFFQNLSESDPIYSLRNDDHFKLEIAYYF